MTWNKLIWINGFAKLIWNNWFKKIEVNDCFNEKEKFDKEDVRNLIWENMI